MMNPQIAALEFIGHSLNPDKGPKTAKTLRSIIESKQLHWEEVAFLANINLVTPLLWMGLDEKGLANELPEDFRTYLAELHRQNTHRNNRLLRQLLEIAQALNRQGIVPVALKGAAYLLTETFPAPGARIMTDLDLLVPKERLSTSVEALQSLGYNADEELKEKYSSHHHYAPLFRPGEFANVELHHTLLYKTATEILPTNTAWKQVEPLEINGVHLQILAPTYRLLHNILHSEIVDGHYERGIISLRGLSDFVYTQHRYQQEIDWSGIKAILTRHGKQNILYSYLYLAHRYLGLPCPAPLRPKNIVSRLHHQRCRNRIRWPWFIKLDRHLQGFSSYRICQRYAYPNTFWALAIGRLRYTAKMAGKCIKYAINKDSFQKRRL